MKRLKYQCSYNHAIIRYKPTFIIIHVRESMLEYSSLSLPYIRYYSLALHPHHNLPTCPNKNKWK